MSNTGENEKIAAILEAALKRFGHYGLAKTTMTEIASDIGMSKASLYYYFPDKEHLFVAVIGKEMGNFTEEVEKYMIKSDGAAKKLIHYSEQRFEYFQKFINLGKFADSSIESLKPAFAKVHGDFDARERQIVQEILQAGIHAGEFSQVDTKVYADMYVSTLHGFRTLIVKQRDSFLLTPEDYSKLSSYHALFTKIFIKGISKTVKH